MSNAAIKEKKQLKAMVGSMNPSVSTVLGMDDGVLYAAYRTAQHNYFAVEAGKRTTFYKSPVKGSRLFTCSEIPEDFRADIKAFKRGEMSDSMREIKTDAPKPKGATMVKKAKAPAEKPAKAKAEAPAEKPAKAKKPKKVIVQDAHIQKNYDGYDEPLDSTYSVEVKCKCGDTRWVKPQDAFHCKECKPCARITKNAKIAARRKAKRAANKLAREMEKE